MSPIESSRFESLVRTHHQGVFRAAFQILRDDDQAKDVTQEVFLSVLEERQRLDEADDVGRVLRWIAVRRALMLLRGASRRRQREDRHAMTRAPINDPDPVLANDDAKTLWRCVARLPDELRRAVVLRFQEGLTYDAMGTALSCSGPTAHDRVRRALDRLKKEVPRLGLAGIVPRLEAALAAQVSVAVPAGLQGTLLGLGTAKAAAVAGGVSAGALIAVVCAVGIAGVGAWVAINPGSDDGAPAPDPVAREAVEDPSRTGDAGGRAVPTEPFRETRPTPRPFVVPPPEVLRPDPGLSSGDPHDGLPAATITGRVVDRDHIPLPGVDVSAYSVERAGKFPKYVVRGSTDAKGVYRVEVPSPNANGDAYQLVFSHVARVTARSEAFTVREDEETRRVDRVMERSSGDREGDYTLDIKVISPDGHPVPTVGLSVWRRVKAENGFRRTHVAGGRVPVSGIVRIEGEWLGPKIVRVDPGRSGYMPLEESFRIDTPGSHSRVIVMRRGLEISGVITDVDGNPIANVDIYGWSGRRAGCMTDGEGRFRIVGLEPDSWSLRFGGGAWSRGEKQVAAGTSGVRIRLKRKSDPTDRGDHLAEIHGRVEDAATGERLTLNRWGFDIDVRRVPDELASARAEDLLPRFLSPRMAQRSAGRPAETPPTSFHKDGLPPGVYVVEMRRRGYAPCLYGPIRLGANEVQAGLVLRLERPARAKGRVLTADGLALAGAFVFATGRGPTAAKTIAGRDRTIKENRGRGTQFWGGFVRTDQDGYFNLGGLPPSMTLAIAAVHPDHGPSGSLPVELTPGQPTSGLQVRMAAKR